MRRKKLEALIEQKLKRTGLNPRPRVGQDWAATHLDALALAKNAVNDEFRIDGRLWHVKHDIEILREETAAELERMYVNGGDRRSDPNRADRNPK